MPRAYLAFKHTHRDRIFGWSTGSGCAPGPWHYPDGLLRRLCEDVRRSSPVHSPVSGTFVCATHSIFEGLPTLDLVFEGVRRDRQAVRVTRGARIHVLPSQAVREGDLVASDAPGGVSEPGGGETSHRRWKRELATLLGPVRFALWARLWFERQFVTVRPGLVHVPSDLSAVAARGHALADGLHWDLTPAMGCYSEAADAFIFPTLRMRTWWGFAGVLPGEVAFDFTPADPRFIPRTAPPTRPMGKTNDRRASSPVMAPALASADGLISR
jgi:hypothetical protein